MNQNIKPQDIKVGTVFFECQYGTNIHATATSEPVQDEHGAYRWTAVDDAGTEINYMLNQNYSAYGPRLYTAPQYFTFDENRNPIFVSSNGKVIADV
jgi:hypothetical protein